MARMTNGYFAAKVGCAESYASRLRNGTRMPSRQTHMAIVNAFGLNSDDAWKAFEAGLPTYKDYLAAHVFSLDVDPVG